MKSSLYLNGRERETSMIHGRGRKMKTKTEPEIVDLMDHLTLLHLFRDYVDECIEDYNHSNKPHPMSFDEWYSFVYIADRDSLTTVIDLNMQSATISGYKSYRVRIPADIVTETGGIIDNDALKKVAKALTAKMTAWQARVLYRGHLVYAWSWD
jgi:hypothetical protein